MNSFTFCVSISDIVVKDILATDITKNILFETAIYI